MRRGLSANVAEAGPNAAGPAKAPAAVKIRTRSASSTSDLAGYLRRCECLVEFVDAWTLEVDVRPGSLSERHARLELDAYLQLWQALDPTVSVERLEPRAASA
jgi:hypothetical protein